MIVVLLMKIKSALLSLLSLVRRGLCCWRKRRRSSESTVVPLTGVAMGDKDKEEEWVDWGAGEGPEIVVSGGRARDEPVDSIAKYRQSLARKMEVQEEQQEQDLFADMVPSIQKQRKVYVGEKTTSSRLGVNLDLREPLSCGGAELGAWEEGAGGAGQGQEWEPEDQDLQQLLKQQRMPKSKR